MWPSSQEVKRLDARPELIELLLRIGAKAQAQSELIALAENAEHDPALQERIGNRTTRDKDGAPECSWPRDHNPTRRAARLRG